MGADIWLKDKEGRIIKQFRDSYNSTNLLNKLGLSWWLLQDHFEIQEGRMSPRQAEIFLSLLETHRKGFFEFGEFDQLKENWQRYYADKYDELVNLLVGIKAC